jgi:hypothetical protein
MAKQFLLDINLFSLLPNNQFGSQNYHCAVDAMMCLVHQVEGAISTSHYAAMILFDISGFFDNLNVDCLIHTVTNLGFPAATCTWVHSFLTDHTIYLTFNGFISEASTISHGTPQGSPLSSILSALYTSLLLKLVNHMWSLCSLNTYIDDGAIVATSATHALATCQAAEGFELATKWLHKNGLATDLDKSEFIPFYKHLSPHTHRLVPDRIHLQNPRNSLMTMKRSSVVCYLSIFLKHNLSRDHYVTIMANRARSMVHAISILGNSVRGINATNWRKIFHALILPILTYRLPLYASQKHVVGLTIMACQVMCTKLYAQSHAHHVVSHDQIT